jgi:hypothetical protein
MEEYVLLLQERGAGIGKRDSAALAALRLGLAVLLLLLAVLLLLLAVLLLLLAVLLLLLAVLLVPKCRQAVVGRFALCQRRLPSSRRGALDDELREILLLLLAVLQLPAYLENPALPSTRSFQENLCRTPARL